MLVSMRMAGLLKNLSAHGGGRDGEDHRGEHVFNQTVEEVCTERGGRLRLPCTLQFPGGHFLVHNRAIYLGRNARLSQSGREAVTVVVVGLRLLQCWMAYGLYPDCCPDPPDGRIRDFASS